MNAKSAWRRAAAERSSKRQEDSPDSQARRADVHQQAPVQTGCPQVVHAPGVMKPMKRPDSFPLDQD